MAISKRTRTKGLEAGQRLLPPGTQIRDYVIGRGHVRFTTGAAIGLGVFCVVFVVAIMMGYVLIPGVLFALYIFSEVRPPVAVIISEQGLALLKRSLWNGKPSSVIALLPPAPMGMASPSGSVTIELGPERVTFNRAEFERLASATASMPVPGPAPTAYPPGVYPPGVH